MNSTASSPNSTVPEPVGDRRSALHLLTTVPSMMGSLTDSSSSYLAKMSPSKSQNALSSPFFKRVRVKLTDHPLCCRVEIHVDSRTFTSIDMFPDTENQIPKMSRASVRHFFIFSVKSSSELTYP